MPFRTFFSLSQSSTKRCFPLLSQSRFVTLRPIIANPAQSQQHETFEEKNLRLKRPLSPHLSIYKVQLTNSLSIMHRITGVAVTGYVAAIAASSSYNLENVITTINHFQLSATTLFVIKAVLALPLSYHAFNGIRHLMWDVGRGLSIKAVYTSGYFVLAGTVIYSLYLAAL